MRRFPGIGGFSSSRRSVPHRTGATKHPMARPLLDGVAKGLAGLEGRRVRGRDGDAFAGAGVSTLARRSRSRREGSEAGDPYGLAAGKRFGDGREHGTHGGVGAWLGNGREGGHAGGKFGLVDPGSPSGIGSSQRITLPTIVPQGIPRDSIQTAVAGADACRDRHRCEGYAVTVRPRGAWSLGFRCRRTDTLHRLVLADSRKRRGNGSGIRRAHPRAALSSEAVRVGAAKDRARARVSTLRA